MIVRKLLATLGVVVGLGLVGSAAGPGWSPEPYAGGLAVESADLAIGGDVVTTPVGTYEVGTEIVEVPLDGATVQAEVSFPLGTEPGARHPGVVFIHGAGTGHHSAFQETARALASAGVVAMVPDKRLDTYTTRHRDYVAMAEDYLVSVAALRERADVDPARVGVYGESEGGWIAPVAAALDPDVAFLVQVSSPVVPPRQQAAFAMDSYLRNVGVPTALLRAIPRSVGATVPGGGFEYADFDVRPYQRQVTQPTLIFYGTADASMPTVQGAEIMVEDLAAAGNDAVTIRYVEGANHGIRAADGVLVPGFTDALARWIHGLPVTAAAAPQVAGAQPVQAHAAAPVAHPRWFADGQNLVTGVQLALGAIAVGPLLWLGSVVVRRRARPLPSPLARWMAGLVLGVVTLLAVFAAYLVRVAGLALNYQTDPLSVVGGWVALEALAVTAAGLLVLSLSRVARAYRSGVLARTGWIGRTTVVGVHLGSLGLLLAAAYWGLFPPVL